MKKIVLVLFFVAFSFCYSNPQLNKQDLRINKVEFIENRGQFVDSEGKQCPEIKFICNYNGHTVYLRNNGISFIFSQGDSNSTVNTPLNYLNSPFENREPRILKYKRADIDFVEINKSFQIETTEKPKYFINYYLPQCPDGLLNVPVYEQIIYRNIYNNIDIVFYENNNQLEYDIMINPGGNADLVKFRASGFDEIKMDESGNLLLETALGKVEQIQPKTYQNNHLIESSFIVNGNEFQIKPQEYDRTKQLRIDPIIKLWGTYLGGNQLDIAFKMCQDNNNDIFIIGSTSSNVVIMHKKEEVQEEVTEDGYLVKFDPNGNCLWYTLFGGNENERLYDIKIDQTSNIYIAGKTSSVIIL